MSLKAIHIIFISCSTLLAFGLGVWCLRAFFNGNGPMFLVGGVGSFGAGVGLIYYGMAIWKKLKDVSWM